MVNSDTIVVNGRQIVGISDAKANRGKMVANSGKIVVNRGKIVVPYW